MFVRLLLLKNIKSSAKRFVSSVTTAHEVLKNNGSISNLSKLKNGFNVASYNNSSNVTTVGVWIESGSTFENSDNNGVAALFEHLLYTGTKNRTTQQLQIELSKFGARLRSYTSRDHTAYYVECLSADVEKVVEILSNVMRNTKFEANKIEEQRSVLLQKLEESELDYRKTVFDNLHRTAFQGTTYSFSPLGSSNSIKALTAEDILNFADDHYKPARMVLTGVGGVNHQHLIDLAEKHFGDLSNEYKRKIPTKMGVRFTGSEFLYRDDNYPHMYGAIAVEGVSRNNIDAIPLLVASTSVGQWDSSHGTSLNAPSTLIQKICQNEQVLHYESFSLNYNLTGLFGFYFVTKGFNDYEIMQFCQTIQRHWKHCAYGVSEDDVDRAKNTLKTRLFEKLENNTSLAKHVANEVLSSGTLTPLHKLERKIHYVDASAVREAVSRHVYDRDLACAGIGLTEAWPNYLALRYGMSWWRL